MVFLWHPIFRGLVSEGGSKRKPCPSTLPAAPESQGREPEGGKLGRAGWVPGPQSSCRTVTSLSVVSWGLGGVRLFAGAWAGAYVQTAGDLESFASDGEAAPVQQQLEAVEVSGPGCWRLFRLPGASPRPSVVWGSWCWEGCWETGWRCVRCFSGGGSQGFPDLCPSVCCPSDGHGLRVPALLPACGGFHLQLIHSSLCVRRGGSEGLRRCLPRVTCSLFGD